MAINNLNDKLNKIISKEPSKWLDDVKWRIENRPWLRISQNIALRILSRIDELKITQKTLAENMGVSPQLVNKWVKGKENFTLETITKLEKALDMKLISVISVESLVTTQEQSFKSEFDSHLINIYSVLKDIIAKPNEDTSSTLAEKDSDNQFNNAA